MRPVMSPWAAAVDVELVDERLHAQFVEEDVGHVGVEMLARVDHDFRQFRVLGNGGGDDARLDELRASAQYGQYLLRHDEISSGAWRNAATILSWVASSRSGHQQAHDARARSSEIGMAPAPSAYCSLGRLRVDGRG